MIKAVDLKTVSMNYLSLMQIHIDILTNSQDNKHYILVENILKYITIIAFGDKMNPVNSDRHRKRS